MKLKRREAVKGMVAAAGVLATGGLGALRPVGVQAAPLAQSLESVSLRLNWQITGPHGAYYLGVERGYWRDHGLDVEIREGNGSVTTAQLVSNKSDTFGLADAAAIIPAIVKGLEVKCVGMLLPIGSLGVIARADSGITTLKDIEGKILAVTPGDSLTQTWPAVVAANGLDSSKIRLVNVDAAAKIPAVLEKRADALLGSVADQNFTIQAQGVPTVDLAFSDYGVNLISLGIFVHPDLIRERPNTIRGFIAGMQTSLAAAEQDVQAGVDLVVKAKPELDPTAAFNQASAWIKGIRSRNCTTLPLAYNCPEDWKSTMDIMIQYRDIQTEMLPEDFYTNDFVPLA
jgi:NitT/TauT family transport system substrate-binding protein